MYLICNKMVYCISTQIKYIISLATCFGFYKTIVRPMLTKGRYIQCVHTLWDPYIQCVHTLWDRYIQCVHTLWDRYIQCVHTLCDRYIQCVHTLCCIQHNYFLNLHF